MPTSSLTSLVATGVLKIDRCGRRLASDSPSPASSHDSNPSTTRALGLEMKRVLQSPNDFGVEPFRKTIPRTGSPRAGYSAVLKAFAFALRPFITLDEDLSASGKVFLVGGPLQYGIPTSLDDEIYLNASLFNCCDPIQSPSTPVYSAEGTSYFEWLRAYVQNVQDLSQKDRLRVLRATRDYHSATRKAEKEFQKALSIFKEAAAVDKNLSFINWMNTPFGKAYRDACDNRDQKEASLRGLQGSGLSDVSRVREVLDSARARLEYKQGNNMPAALRDISSGGSPQTVYLPLYYLSGYASASKHWIMGSSSLKHRDVTFNPLQGSQKGWGRLGLPTVTDKVLEEVPGWIKDVTIIIRFRGIGSFDVHRGLWDITGLNTVLPPLDHAPPQSLNKPVLKTTKLLIAYGVKVIIILPPPISQELREQLSGNAFTILPEILGNLAPTWSEDGNIEATLPEGNAYPVLLGVLAHWINA